MIEFRLRVLVLLLTLLVMAIYIATVFWDRAMRRRCVERGHVWEEAPDGVRCRRCTHKLTTGDYL